MNIKDRVKELLVDNVNKNKSSNVSFKDYATPSFLKLAKEIDNDGKMNMYVDGAISKKVSSAELEKEINMAMKQHRKMDSQKGSSPLHSAVVLAMTRLLAELRKSVKEFQDKAGK